MVCTDLDPVLAAQRQCLYKREARKTAKLLSVEGDGIQTLPFTSQVSRTMSGLIRDQGKNNQNVLYSGALGHQRN